MVGLATSTELESWLQGKPRDVANVIAARAALRAIPALARALGPRASRAREAGLKLFLPVFRATAAPWVAAKHANHRATIRDNTDIAAAAAFNVDFDYDYDFGNENYSDAEAVADASAYAGETTDPTRAGYVAAAVEAVEAAAEAAAAIYAAVSADTTAIDRGASVSDLAGRLLWWDGTPGRAQQNWTRLKQALLALDEDWEVWTEWYEARRDGRAANEALEVARVMIAEGIWKQGPKVVNAEIKRLIEEHSLARPTAGSGQAKWGEFRWGGKDEPPSVSIQRPAAIEPTWNDNILTIPKTPAPTDQGDAGFTSALRGLRSVLHNFADEISGEANIDRRFVSFVRRLADQIPEAAPPQHELFEIGHIEAVFAEYVRTVNDQWPNFLAARYHAVVLQFDRTMRQSAAWRDFKRNAQEAQFTDAQTREAAELANAAAATLRNDEAGEFVDPLVPQILEHLADPRSRWQDDALAAIEAGKEELAADLIESTNNIFKAVAEVALPVVTEIAAAARQTAGKTAAAFWQEFEKGAVAEAKARGRPAGRAAVRWLLRFATVTGGTAGIAGAAYGGYAAFSKLMTQYPEAFGWLQQLLRFFQQALPPL